MKKKYSDTILLPVTSFQIKGNHKQREETLLDFWDKSNLWQQRKNISEESPGFIIHDGPPYANGNLHMGHALNKILKDIVGRFFYLYGHRVDYRPGWDCHGLPIEWIVEQEYRKEKISKDDVPILEFRERCRQFASKWINIQRDGFERLGVLANWNSVYKTMDFESEAQIVEQLLKINRDGNLYESYKPVLWSIAEKTSLAEAEVEYKDIDSRAMFAKFPLLDESASLLIWTTTPWTLPANRGLAYSIELSYGTYSDGDECLIFADQLLEEVNRISNKIWKRKFNAPPLKDVKCRHPFYGTGDSNFDFIVPVLEADFVTSDKGTGIVHVAPAHGEQDFALTQTTKFCEVKETVCESGFYTMDKWKDIHIFKALPIVRDLLNKNKRLLGEENYSHSYPHSWRSGTPLIYRATKQLFFDLSLSGVLRDSIKEVEKIHFTPGTAEHRLKATLESRPDWLLSRQRYWGVPITLFVHKTTKQILCDDEIDKRILDCIKKEGGDAWISRPNEDFFGDRIDADDFYKMDDVLDVWFDSGCSHLFVLKGIQADLYIEGSDQHRGWFQSSLLIEMQKSGKSPYKGMISHGFVLDEKGYKMSKSVGNVTHPETIIKQHGADLIRLWVASSEFTRDLRVGSVILRNQAEILYKFRNTLRYMLGNLCRSTSRVDLPNLHDEDDLHNACFVDRWILHKLFVLNREIEKSSKEYAIHKCYLLLHEFCDKELSSFYFDILKDTLYCDSEESERRKYAIAVLLQVFYFVIRWLSPIIPFTAEEAFLEFAKSKFCKTQGHESVHYAHDLAVSRSWLDESMSGDVASKVFSIRKVANKCLEEHRKRGEIGSSSEAFLKVFLSEQSWIDALYGVNMKEICLVSGVELVLGRSLESFQIQEVKEVGIVFSKFGGTKCPRCWLQHHEKDLCPRCKTVLNV